MRVVTALLAAGLAAGCSRSTSQNAALGSTAAPPTTGRRVVATFDGVVDEHGVLSLTPAVAAAAPSALVNVPVVQDGVKGSNPPDTLELVTNWMNLVADGCGKGVNAFDANVTVRSFFAKARLSNVYVEILTMTPTGREACNSAAPPSTEVSNAFGLFAYGTLEPIGIGVNEAAATWRFRLPDQTPFTFSARVMADVFEDRTAPTTVAFPPPGVYFAPVDFFAGCNDGPAGSGCKATYYTTDGTTPTTSSPVLTAPVHLTAPTTVSFFSVDAFDNAETIQSAAYVVDLVPPTVIASNPSAYQTGLDPNGPFTVTFSEPVDPSTVYIVVTYPGGGYSYGNIVPDADDRTVSWVPSQPLFPGTVLGLRVAGACHFGGGRCLESPYEVPFLPGPPIEYTGPTGSAIIDNGALATNIHQDALAVWTESTGAGRRLYAAHRFAGAASGWDPPFLLEEVTSDGPAIPVRVVETYWGFFVVWSSAGATRATLVENTTGLPAAWGARTLWAAPSADGDFAITQGYGSLEAIRTDGSVVERVTGTANGDFAPPRPIAFSAHRARWPSVALRNGLLRVVFADAVGIYLAQEDHSSTGGWRDLAVVPDSQGAAVVAPVLLPTDTIGGVATPDGCLVAWATPSGFVRGIEHDGTAFVGGASTTLGFDPSALPLELVGAGGGDYGAVAWRTATQVLAALHTPAAWKPDETLQSFGGSPLTVSITTAFEGYTVAFEEDRGGVPTYATLDATVWPDPGQDPFWGQMGGFGSWNGVRSPRVADAGATLVTWVDSMYEPPNGARDQLRSMLWPNGGGDFVSTFAVHGSEASYVSAVVTTHALVFGSIHDDRGTQVAEEHTCWYDANGNPYWWDQPPLTNALAGKVIVAGTVPQHIVVARQPYPSQQWTVYAVSAYGMSTDLLYIGEPSPPTIAAAGHSAGAVVASLTSDALTTFFTDTNGVWGFYGRRSASLATPPAVSAAAGAGGAVVAWRDLGSGDGVPRLAFDVVRGQLLPPLPTAPAVGTGGARFAAGDPVDPSVQYGPFHAAVAWELGGDIQAAVFPGPVPYQWSPIASLSAPGATCETPELATDGVRFLAVFRCGGMLNGAFFDGTAWSQPFPIAPAPLAFAVAGSPGGFRVAAVLDGAVPHAFLIRVAGTVASPPQPLDDGAGAVRPAISLDAGAGWFCAGWSQVEDDPLAARAHAKCFL